MHAKPTSFPRALRGTAVVLAAAALAGCSSLDSLLSGDKIDYRSSAGQTKGLEVPPDLSQLPRDSRYVHQGTVSASALAGQGAAPSLAAPAGASVAPNAIGEMRVVRDGQQRWLAVPLPPEQVWPVVRAFWEERGFTIASENREAGVMETDWAENRAKIPTDVVRNTIGKMLDSLYSTGERDKFRTRIERAAAGSEIYISHRGLEEVFVGTQKDRTMWTARAADPQLEAEFLSRLMVRIGAREDVARTSVAAAAPGAPRARLLAEGGGAAIEVDDTFDRAWRRVAVALDRAGFTVEDRDRSNGVFFVRYVDPKQMGKEEPGFFARLLSFGKDRADGPDGPGRYRIALKASGERTAVSVVAAQGNKDQRDVAQRIAAQLVDELK